jgi:hypothetical protein
MPMTPIWRWLIIVAVVVVLIFIAARVLSIW